MRILILGAGKMGSFFTDVLSFQHETAVFDVDPKRLRFCPWRSCGLRPLSMNFYKRFPRGALPNLRIYS